MGLSSAPSEGYEAQVSPVEKAKTGLQRVMERLAVPEASRGDRIAFTLQNGPGDDLQKSEFAQKGIADARNERIYAVVEEVVGGNIENLKKLKGEAFAGHQYDRGVSFLEKIETNLESSKINNQYRIPRGELQTMLDEMKTPPEVQGKQKEFYDLYRFMIESLLNVADPIMQNIGRPPELLKNMWSSEQGINDTAKVLVFAGVGVLTLLSLLRGKPNIVTLFGAGIMAYMAFPGIFKSEIQHFNDKIDVVEHTDFQRIKSTVSPELADEIWGTDATILSAIQKKSSHYYANTKARFTEKDLTELRETNGVSGMLLEYISSHPAHDSGTLITKLKTLRQTDNMTLDARDTVKRSLAMNTAEIGAGMDAARKAEAGTGLTSFTLSS